MLKQKIQQDLKRALKAKKKIEVSILRFLLASILNREKEKRAKIAKEERGLKEEDLVEKSHLTDEEVVETTSKEFKKIKEAISDFEKGKREDLVKKGERELEILKRYLPKQLSEKEIKNLAEKVIKETGAENLKDLGKVMGKLMPKIKGRAEGKKVANIVRNILS